MMANKDIKYDTYYHGTCADHIGAILKSGLGGYHNERLWSDSDYHHTYFWSPSSIRKHNNGLNCQKISIEEATTQALDLARISAHSALIRAKDCRIIIIEARLPIEWVSEDCSGPNMQEMGAVCTDMIISPSMIKSIKVSQDLSIMKPLFATSHTWKQNSTIKFTKLEKFAIKFIKEADYCEIEELIEWEEVSLPRTKNIIYDKQKIKLA